MQYIQEKIRSYDLFAIPVGLTYKGQNEFNTLFGGCTTVLLGIFLSALFVQNVLKHKFDPDYVQDRTDYYKMSE